MSDDPVKAAYLVDGQRLRDIIAAIRKDLDRAEAAERGGDHALAVAYLRGVWGTAWRATRYGETKS